jgi:hypothetical protein
MCEGTIKMNVFGSVGNTISYHTGGSGGLGGFAEQSIGISEEKGKVTPGTRCQPSSLVSTSKLVEQ